MSNLKHNLKFYYCYRDGANNKKTGEVIFSNPNEMSPTEVDEVIRNHLIADFGFSEMKWFLPKEWQLDTLYFEDWDYEIDYPYHTYDEVTVTQEPCTSNLSIDQFLEVVKNGNNRLVI
jgi:hypothetical protein